MEYKIEVEVGWDMGLHIRPAAEIVKLLQKFPCDVKILKNDLLCNAKSVMQLITLDASKGTKLVIIASGEGAQEAILSLETFFYKYKDDSDFDEVVF